MRNGKSSVFSTQLNGFNISRSFRTSSSVSLMPGVITCRIITLFFAFSHSARNASGAERLTPMYFLYRSSRENFMSSKTISVLPRSFFTLSFIMTPEVSSAVPMPSSLSLVNSSYTNSTCKSGSPPDTVTPPSLPKYERYLKIFFTASSTKISSPAFLSQVSGL